MTTNPAVTAAQTPAPGEYIELFELDATSLGGDVYHFTLAQYASGPVMWNGVAYVPIDVEFNDMETTSTGAMPQPSIKVRNYNYVFSTLISQFGDGVGATLTRLKTFSIFLDGQPDADPNAYLSLDSFVIEQKTHMDNVYIEWKLSSVLDQEGLLLPGRNILRDTCTWVYRSWDDATQTLDYTNVTCPYTGGAYFQIDGTPTPYPQDDVCSHDLTGCKLRFGQNGDIPGSFFPGVGQFSGGGVFG